jgi:hypothetical protein
MKYVVFTVPSVGKCVFLTASNYCVSRTIRPKESIYSYVEYIAVLGGSKQKMKENPLLWAASAVITDLASV